MNPNFLLSSEAQTLPKWRYLLAGAVGFPMGLLIASLARSLRVRFEGYQNIPKGGPVIFVAWHRFSWVAVNPAICFSPLQNVTWLGHDGFLSLLFTVAPAWLGMRFFTFSIGSQISGSSQVSSFLRKGDSILIFGDSGGPYEKLKTGVVKLGIEASCPILPIGFEVKNRWIFGRKLRHVIPLPFAKVTCRLGTLTDCGMLSLEQMVAVVEKIQEQLKRLSPEPS